MKARTTLSLLALSLAANAGLLWQLRQNITAGTEKPTPAIDATPGVVRPTPPVPGATWTALQVDGDLPAYVANLRDAGYPPYIVRALITAALGQRDAAREKELWPIAPFWEPSRLSLEQLSDLSALHRARALELAALLGPDAQPEYGPDATAEQKRRYGYLPPKKIAQIERLGQDYSDLTEAVYAEARGLMLPEDKQRLAYLEAEQRKDLARLLTPAELEEYDMRNSTAAYQVRDRFIAVNLTEEEFRAAYRLQVAFEAKVAALGNDRAAGEARAAARQQLQADFQALLDPARRARYALSSEDAYRGLFYLATRTGHTRETADAVYQIHQDVQAQAAALRGNRALNPEERQTQLAALATTASATVARTLGPRGTALYQQQYPLWISSITAPKGAVSKNTANPTTPAGATH